MIETSRIKGLDGIRAVSVALVVLVHLGYGLEQQGTVGVTIFFALSGFLITRLLILEYTRFGRISLRNFYIRRTLRIFPLYFLVVALTGLISVLVYPVADRVAMSFAALYATNFIVKSHYSGLLGHTWSLAVEEHFYLIWPALLAFWIKGNWRLAAIFLICCAGLSLLIANLLFTSSYLSTRFFLDRWTFVASSAISFGSLIAVFTMAHAQQRAIGVLSNNLCLLIGTLLVAQPVVVPHLPFHLGYFLCGLGAAVVVGWFFLNQSSVVVGLFEIAPLRYIGKISYGIYMWQGFFLATGPERAPSQTWPPPSALGLLLLCIVAPLSFQIFEQPILKLKRRFERVSLELEPKNSRLIIRSEPG